MINFVFNRLNKLNKDGKGAITFSITLDGRRKYIASKFYVFPSDWDEKKQEVRKSNPDYLQINRALRNTKTKWENRETELRCIGDHFTIDDIVNDAKVFGSFNDYCRREAQKRLELGKIQYSQYNSYMVVIDELAKFKGTNIPFAAVNVKFVADFRDHVIRARAELANVTKRRYLTTLKALVNACADDKLIEPVATNRVWGIKAESEPRENLTFAQLHQLETITFADKNLDLYRDMFLAGCYTGLRFSDLIDLKKSNIIVSPDDNGTYLKVQERKTKKWKYNIPLHRIFNGKALAIFAKYQTKYRDTIFAPISIQAVNRNLKVIQQIMQWGDIKKMGFHISRHTFGTLLAELGVPIYLLQEYMNHSDIKTTQKYIHNSRMNQNKMLANIVFPE